MNRLWAILPAAALLLASCQPGQQAARIDKPAAALAAADSAEYLDRMSSRPTVGEADAFLGMLLVLGEPGQVSFQQAVDRLVEKKVVSRDWDFRADRPITRGRVAYMAFQAMHLQGGVTLTLLGPTQRYCLRELQYRGLMSPGLTYNTVTGMEYVSVLARVDEMRQTGKVSQVMSRQEGYQP